MKPLIASLVLITLLHFIPQEANAQCEPFFGKLIINEFMASNNSTASDEFGEFDDWVEIYNGSDEPIDMEGYFLSDNHGNRTKFVFPSVIIEPDDVLIIWCDGQPEQGDLHTSFRLSADGEELGLYNHDTTSVDYVRFGPQPTDITTGRFPNGRGPFNLLIPTFNAANTNTVDPGLVINEYQAINESTADDQWGAFEDWIELYNNSNQPIDLTGYFLSDKIGTPTLFQFPDTFIGPNEYLIIWCDMGLMEPGLHTVFRLGGSGDDIILSDADTTTIDYVRFGLQIPDDSEGRFPNGTGAIACMAPTWNESNGGVVGLFDVEKPKALKAWPNPANERIFIDTQNQWGSVIRVYSAVGTLMDEIKIQSSPLEIDLLNYSPGFYIAVTDRGRSKFIVR